METVGFRFHPNDNEIINHYLVNKINGQDFDGIIAEIDLCRFDPWELPGISAIEDNEEWYFFCRLDYKYKNSKRANRTTKLGYWKPTGKVRSIKGRGTNEEIGTKRTLVFYSKVDARKAVRTPWVIHEYQLKATILPPQREFVFCKLKDKSDDQTDKNLAIEEGEQNHRVVFDVETHISPPTMHVVDEELIPLSQTGDLLDFGDLSPEEVQAIKNCFNGSPNRNSSEDEEDPLFVGSLLVEPEEYVSEARRTLPNDYRPQRPLSEVYYQNVSDMKSQVVHTESVQDVATSRLYPVDRDSTELRRIRRVQTLAETSPPLKRDMDERRMTGFDDKLHINVLTRVTPPAPKEPRKIEYVRFESGPSMQLQGKMSSTKSKNEVEEVAPRYTSVKQGFVAVESQKGSVTAKVTGANQELKIKSSGLLGSVGKVSFIHMEAPTLNNRTGPRSVYAFNIVVALAVSIAIVGWFFT